MINIRCVFISGLLLSVTASASAEEPAHIETIVVSGQAAFGNEVEASRTEAKKEIENTPGGVTLIDVEEVRERNVSSLADLLRYAPGIYSVSDTGNDGIFFSSRGSNLDATDFDMNGIKLLQDGLPVTTAAGDNHNRIIDPLSAQYAVVARGANAIKYGASTLGGAINFISPTAYDSTLFDFYFNGGSHGQRLGRASTSGITDAGLGGLLTLEAKQWDGYRDHNEQNRVGLYSNAGWRISDSMVTRFYGTYLENDQELPAGLSRAQVDEDRDQAGQRALDGDFQLDVETWRIANKTTWKIDEDRTFEIGFSYEDQKLFHPIVSKVFVDFDGPGPMVPTEVFGGLLIDTDHKDIGTALRYNQQAGRHDILMGLNAGKNTQKGNQFGNDGGERDGLFREVDNKATTVEAFILDRWKFHEQWTFIAGLQGISAYREVELTDSTGIVTNNPDDHYSRINPRLGLIYEPVDAVSLYANVSQLFEPPTNFELEDNVAGGDEALDAMHGTVVEIGIRGERPLWGLHRWQWELSLYYAWIQDEILSIEDPNQVGNSLSTNIDDTKHAGIEALIASEFYLDSNRMHTIAPMVSVTINDFEFDDDDAYGNSDLPAAPDYIVRGEILYRHASGFYMGPTFDFVGDRYADFTNSYKISAYNLVGLRAGWSNHQVRLFAEVRNIFDQDYIVSHSVRDNAPVDAEILNPGEPISAFIGLQIRM